MGEETVLKDIRPTMYANIREAQRSFKYLHKLLSYFKVVIVA